MTGQLTEIKFKPGIIKDDTRLASEGAYVDSDKIRFRLGKPQVIGGWEQANLSSNQFTNPVRGSYAWAALSGDRVAGFGTASNLYSFFGGSILDITPLKYRGTLVDPFTTTNGSSTVLVYHPDHGLKTGDLATYSLADAVGGLTITGAHAVTVVTFDTYTIDAGSNASSDSTGGGVVEVTVPLDTGNVDGIGGSGFGTGAYGAGYFGLPTIGDLDPRVWSCSDWGNNGVFVPRNGALYEYQPSTSYVETVTNGDFASSSGWTRGTGWTISGGVATATNGVASVLSRDLTGVISGGLVYQISVDVTVSAGTCQFIVTSADAGDVSFGQAFTKSGTYVRNFRAPSNPTLIKFSKGSTFIGTLDNVSIKLVSIAYRIQAAPQYATGGFVDAHRFVVLYGTVDEAGNYNPMNVRWCDQENIEQWLADSTNLAGDFVLGNGSRLVGAVSTRSENLLFSDTAAFQMQYTGDSGSVFSFNLVGTGCGLIGKNAVAEHNGWVFWMGNNGQFYVYRGGEPQIIECPIQKDILDNIATSQQEKIFCWINSKFSEVNWLIPDSRDGNECSRMATYNFVDDVWAQHTFARSSAIKSGVFSDPMMFGIDGNIYLHERGNTANGSRIDWSLETSFFDLEDGNNFIAVKSYMPDFDAQVGNIDITLSFRNSSNGAQRDFGPYEFTTTSERVPLRAAGRQMGITWEAGTNSKFMRLGTQRFEIDKTGIRR